MSEDKNLSNSELNATDYSTYSSLDGLYGANNTFDEVLDQVETDLKEAMELLPNRQAGAERSNAGLNA